MFFERCGVEITPRALVNGTFSSWFVYGKFLTIKSSALFPYLPPHCVNYGGNLTLAECATPEYLTLYAFKFNATYFMSGLLIFHSYSKNGIIHVTDIFHFFAPLKNTTQIFLQLLCIVPCGSTKLFCPQQSQWRNN